jgi:isopentenyl diphosphate isomerase/L-lactate dehydrogenase-like FMN-dependent dehydrogenase
VFITVGSTDQGRATGHMEWSAVDAMRRAVAVPVVVKGIASVDDARAALAAGAQAIVVSGYGQAGTPGRPASLDVLPAVVNAVEGRVPVLVDGGFRPVAHGAGARAVSSVAVMGARAYGADGVQAVIEMLQTELGRVMGCCGTPNLAAITRSHIKVHGPNG